MAAKNIEVREQSVAFDLILPESLPEFMVEGISQAMLGNLFSKLVFHSTIEQPTNGGTVEQRQAVVRLVIPTLALAETCRNVLAAIATNRQGLVDATAKYPEQLAAVLQGVNVIPTPVSAPKKK